jgi:hypothetical protein
MNKYGALMTEENGSIQRKIFAYHKSHMDRLGIERVSPQLKAAATTRHSHGTASYGQMNTQQIS